MTEVEVMGVAFDGSTNMLIVVLKDKKDRTLPKEFVERVKLRLK